MANHRLQCDTNVEVVWYGEASTFVGVYLIHSSSGFHNLNLFSSGKMEGLVLAVPRELFVKPEVRPLPSQSFPSFMQKTRQCINLVFHLTWKLTVSSSFQASSFSILESFFLVRSYRELQQIKLSSSSCRSPSFPSDIHGTRR